MRLLKTLQRYLAFLSTPPGFPLVLAGVLLAAFGLLLPRLGYYWDDWLSLYFMHFSRTPADFLIYPFRPLHAWLDFWQFRLFGPQPWVWHLYSLLMRGLAAWLVWCLVRRLWPRRAEYAFWVALLFAIYPAFQSQPMAVIYRQQWTTTVLFLLSLLAMLAAPQNPRRAGIVVLAGVLALAASLFITEYLLGLEAARPLLLWGALAATHPRRKARARAVLAAWWPYLLTGLGFVVWRFFLLELREDPNPPVLLDALRASPLQGVLLLTQMAAQDLVHLWWTVWANLLQPALLNWSARFNLFAWGVGLVVGTGLFVLARPFRGVPEPDGWRGPLFLGGLLTALGMLASWVVGRQVAAPGLFADRLSLSALLGASLFMAALVMALVARPTARALVFSLLVGLSVSAHLRTANDYAWDWEIQRRFFWQLVERAPAVEPGTLIIPDGAVTRSLSRYNIAFALNILYGGTTDPAQPAIWAMEFDDGLYRRLEEFPAGAAVREVFYNVDFRGTTTQSLLLFGPPENATCWWLLSGRDAANWQISADLRQAAASASQAPIRPGAGLPAAQVFGAAMPSTWCLLFQTADRARAAADWNAVRTLEDEARQQGWLPGAADGYELLPFVEAALHTSDWQSAQALSLSAYHRSFAVQAMLCTTWEEFAAQNSPPPEFLAAWGAVQSGADCPD